MSKYTAEQVFLRSEDVKYSIGIDYKLTPACSDEVIGMLREHASLLRERESAKAAVADETRGTCACPICGKEYPHYHPEDTSRVNWHSDYRKVFEDIISANVRLYKDGVSIAPTNYSHESKLTVAGIAGHWFAYGAEDARSFGRESKGTDSAAWSEFASNGDGYAYAWMDSLWSLFKQTVVALKRREAMLATAPKPETEE